MPLIRSGGSICARPWTCARSPLLSAAGRRLAPQPVAAPPLSPAPRSAGRRLAPPPVAAPPPPGLPPAPLHPSTAAAAALPPAPIRQIAEMYKAAAFRLLQRSVFRGDISSQHAALAAPASLLHRRYYAAPWRAEELPGMIQRRFHGIIKQSGRPPALAQTALLHRRHHTTPWRGEVSASTLGLLPRNSLKHYFSASARWVSYFWCLCKVAAAAACTNVMFSFLYHTYLVRVPYTSRTPIFRLETVPYTNRKHYVIRSPLDDRDYGESCFAMDKKKLSSDFLSPLHPDSVRVNLITAQLLPAVQRGLDIKKRHAIESEKQGKSCRSQPQITHLDGLDWEVFVMKNDGHVGAVSWSNGKILVCTGLLNHLETDAEIATILAHEIAHLVARHWSETIIYKKWSLSPQGVLH